MSEPTAAERVHDVWVRSGGTANRYTDAFIAGYETAEAASRKRIEALEAALREARQLAPYEPDDCNYPNCRVCTTVREIDAALAQPDEPPVPQFPSPHLIADDASPDSMRAESEITHDPRHTHY